jgi:adenosine deaminase
MGFFTNAHAGEVSGPQSVWEAIHQLQVDRIGHGTNIHEDPGLVEHIAENRIPIELCPMSNVRTGAVRSIKEHPIRNYFDRGLIISVNTDDPKMFNTILADEYRILTESCGFSKKDICKIILTGIRSSWQPEEKKNALVEKFQKEPSWEHIMGKQSN